MQQCRNLRQQKSSYAEKVTVSKPTTIRFPARLKTQLRIAAAERNATMEQVVEEIFAAYFDRTSGESTTPQKIIAPSTEVREDTFTALRDALARVPESLRAELLEVLERTAALVARGLGSTTKEGLQRSAELRRIAAEQAAIEQHINRRLAAKKSPATSTTAAHGGAGGEESERDEPAGKKKAK